MEKIILTYNRYFKSPIKLVFGFLVVIGLLAGIYQDIIKELFLTKVNHTTLEKKETIHQNYIIEIPISIESSWEDYTMLERKAEFYIVRNESPVLQNLIFSGSAKIIVPENAMTVNDTWINIESRGKLETKVILPNNKKLVDYLNEGGYEIQLLIFDQHGSRFVHTEQKLFDKEILDLGFRYWFRLIPEQVLNKS